MSTTAQPPMLDADDLGPADEALLDLLREGRVTAPFAAEETGYSLQYVRDRLGRLVEHGNARKVYEGLYELVKDPRRAAGAADSDGEGRGETAEDTAPETDERPAVARPDVETDNEVAILEQLQEAVPGSGELAERRADEIVAMYEYLKEHGSAEKDDLLGAVDVEATDYAGAESVWSNMVKGKSTLKSLPGVISPPAGKSEWKYREENDG